MNDMLHVRPAAPADAPRMAVLSTALGYPVDAATLEQRLVRLLGRPDDVVLVAEMPPGLVVGWIHGAEHNLLEGERRCEILGLVVDAGHRKRGAGRRLVDAVERWALARGLALMSVRSNVVRTESHPFYERLGYVREKTQHAYRRRLPQ